MSKTSIKKDKGKNTLVRMLMFPLGVLLCYGMLYLMDTHKTLTALKISGGILLTIALPLILVFVIMLVLNLLVTPARIVGLFGKGVRIKGIVLSMAAGIISMGPIYAWYPLLKDLREKGMGTGPIAIFLYSRAVKPFLLPVMIAYFGWAYVGILTTLTLVASIATGCCMSVLIKQ